MGLLRDPEVRGALAVAWFFALCFVLPCAAQAAAEAAAAWLRSRRGRARR